MVEVTIIRWHPKLLKNITGMTQLFIEYGDLHSDEAEKRAYRVASDERVSILVDDLVKARELAEKLKRLGAIEVEINSEEVK